MAFKGNTKTKKLRFNKKKTSKRSKRFSLMERIRYHGKKLTSSDNNKRAFALGYIDSATGEYLDSKKYGFKNESEHDSYFSGVDKGNKALYKSKEIKF